MKEYKAVFWTGEMYKTVFIRRKNIHFVVLCCADIINNNNWELTSLSIIY